jgi:hypothetical protein
MGYSREARVHWRRRLRELPRACVRRAGSIWAGCARWCTRARVHRPAAAAKRVAILLRHPGAARCSGAVSRECAAQQRSAGSCPPFLAARAQNALGTHADTHTPARRAFPACVTSSALFGALSHGGAQAVLVVSVASVRYVGHPSGLISSLTCYGCGQGSLEQQGGTQLHGLKTDTGLQVAARRPGSCRSLRAQSRPPEVAGNSGRAYCFARCSGA